MTGTIEDAGFGFLYYGCCDMREGTTASTLGEFQLCIQLIGFGYLLSRKQCCAKDLDNDLLNQALPQNLPEPFGLLTNDASFWSWG